MGVVRGAGVYDLAVMELAWIEDWHVSALSSWAVSTAAGEEMETNSPPRKMRKDAKGGKLSVVGCQLSALGKRRSETAGVGRVPDPA